MRDNKNENTKLKGSSYIMTVETKQEQNDNYTWRIAGIQMRGRMQLDESGKRIVGGSSFRLFNILQDKLKFRYELITPILRGFGIENETGYWNGTVGQLVRQEADMNVAPFFLTYDRFRVIDYSSHLYFIHMKFIIKLPEPKTAWNSLILPFSFQIWIAIAVTLLIFGISLHKIMEKDNDLSGTNSHWPRRKIFWFLFGTLTFQGENLNSISRFPSRLLIAIWWMSIFILISSYTGTLMSFMTCPIVEPVPSTFDELAFAVASGEYSCGTIKGYTDETIMAVSIT
ncbi:glutamate receptor ionotropic, delta-1-like [Centruroides vittatus]|uniref:glutamate receptor ionotropic, delta-1-like n=1 Tax=Centruroides vittatus TaxID=120091 RepID=UPI00350F8DD4